MPEDTPEGEPARYRDVTAQVFSDLQRDYRLWQDLPKSTHPIFGRMPAPERPEELLTILRLLGRLQIGAWRGQASATWTIDSSLARRYHQRAWLGPHYRLTEENVRPVEKAFIERARSVGQGQGLSELELMARLQHHGAATRLLDCSRNAFVATWFACREGKHAGADGLLIGLRLHEHARHLNTEMLSMDLHALLDSDERPLWWAPRSLSPRIAAQQAIFILGRIAHESWGSISLGQSNMNTDDTGNVPGTALVLITPKLKDALHTMWGDLFGFSNETLFPDFDGFAQAHGIDEDFPNTFPLGAPDARS